MTVSNLPNPISSKTPPGKAVSAKQRNRLFKGGVSVFLGALFCCALWGSAFPTVKIGMKLFGVVSSDISGQILFGGMRFMLAGVMILLLGSLLSKKPLLPNRKTHPKKILILALFQTVLQYVPYYIGLGHATGTNGAIVNSLSNFFTILVAALLFRLEKLRLKTVAGCILGFLGVVLINLTGQGYTFHFTLFGEGLVLCAAISNAFSSVFVKIYSRDDDPVLLCGWQFFVGGSAMSLIGLLLGGRIHTVSLSAVGMLIYLAFISTGAYTLWTILLKYNDVSKIAVFGFMTPVFGVLLSVLLLGETQGFQPQYLIALILISVGITLVNIKGND